MYLDDDEDEEEDDEEDQEDPRDYLSRMQHVWSVRYHLTPLIYTTTLLVCYYFFIANQPYHTLSVSLTIV